MARKYKLRFADRTTLALDEDGLRTWTERGMVDKETTVQPPGSKAWYPLKEFLASERAGPAGRAASPAAESAGASSIRLKPIDDEPEPAEEDVYDGEYGPGPFSVVWLWIKRLVLTAAVLIGVGTAAAWWPVWVPKATELSFVVFTAIHDRLKPPAPAGPNAEQEPRTGDALPVAAEQLPHLAPETIQLVMRNSFVGALDPPEVFRRAQEAVQRGLPSLAPEEAQEVRDLKAALMAALRPEERERLREYEQARGSRVTLPFEDRQALALTARATRALTAARRQRLQSLLAKAAAAGMSGTGSPPAASPQP